MNTASATIWALLRKRIPFHNQCRFLAATGVDHAFSATGHDVNPIVNTPAMSAEFMVVAPTSNNLAYLVTPMLQDRPGFITTHFAGRNKQIEVGMRVAVSVISQLVCMALSGRDGSK